MEKKNNQNEQLPLANAENDKGERIITADQMIHQIVEFGHSKGKIREEDKEDLGKFVEGVRSTLRYRKQ